MTSSCEGIVSAGISAMLGMNSPCGEFGGVDRRRALATGPTISGDVGHEEYARSCRFSCCSSNTSLDSVATVLLAASGPDPVSSPSKTLRKFHQNGTIGITVLNTYYTEPVVWLVHNAVCLASVPSRPTARLPIATGVRVAVGR